MIYIIGIRSYDEITDYKCFDTATDSTFDISERKLTKLIKSQGLVIENAKAIGDELTLDKWFNGTHHITNSYRTGSDYTLLSKLANDNYKVIDYNGHIMGMWEKGLRRCIEEKKVSNCTLNNGEIVSVGTCNLARNIQLEESIDSKYEIFIAKTKLLGYDMSFNYKIEGTQVKLTSYECASKEVIVPKFITAITDRSFLECEITKITMDRGLTHIGGYAFHGCNLSEITIPDTVQIICLGHSSRIKG